MNEPNTDHPLWLKPVALMGTVVSVLGDPPETALIEICGEAGETMALVEVSLERLTPVTPSVRDTWAR